MGSARYSHQVAAVPVRLDPDHRLEVCLVTSRTTNRWIIPKGWPMKGLRDDEAAAVEAKEEAGLIGPVFRPAFGSYTYWRRTRTDFRLTRVDVFVLKVKRQKRRWKEQAERRVAWVPLLEAADMVLEPELSSLLIRIPGMHDVCRFIGKDGPIQF